LSFIIIQFGAIFDGQRVLRNTRCSSRPTCRIALKPSCRSARSGREARSSCRLAQEEVTSGSRARILATATKSPMSATKSISPAHSPSQVRTWNRAKSSRRTGLGGWAAHSMGSAPLMRGLAHLLDESADFRVSASAPSTGTAVKPPCSEESNGRSTDRDFDSVTKPLNPVRRFLSNKDRVP
jgi:hypothetical protein